MATYSLESLGDFILQLFDKENEEELWETWLHKEYKDSFKEFKKKYFKKMQRSNIKILSKEEEQKIIERATQFIRPINKVGEK